MTYSLNIWGHHDDEESIEKKIVDFVKGLEGIGGGTLNTGGRPQVTFGGNEAQEASTVSDETQGAETPAGTDPSDTAAETAPETAQETEADAPADPIHTLSKQELEDELNRRSAEGANVTSDGTPLQEANAADIEAEISSRGSTEE